MTRTGALRRACGGLALGVAWVWVTGCSSLPFTSNDAAGGTPDNKPQAASAQDGAASGAASGPADTAHADYRLDVQAPADLRKLLASYLDLARFQNAPAADGIDAAELERLRRAAPAQARALLETEGYFNATVTVDRVDEPGAAKPLMRVVVEPGPRTRVDAVAVDAVGALTTSADAGDTTAATRLAALRSQWKLPVGDAFAQSAWSSAKTAALTSLRADGYASAEWRKTDARIDAVANRARLAVEIDSGPLYRLGPLKISGLKRYPDDTVRNLAGFEPGDPYTEKALLDYQERLQKVGLFEGVSVEVDPAIDTAEAAPVRVRVREQPLQDATVGVGVSANTGPRLSVEHTHRQMFGFDWIAKNKLVLGPTNQQWDGDMTSYPRKDRYRNFVGGSAQRLRTDDQTLTSYDLRVGRYKEEPRIDRRYFIEVAHAKVATAELDSQGDSVSANYYWLVRDLDNPLAPTRGYALSTQSGLGYARGTRAFTAMPRELARGPFSRLYARLSYYQPIAGWYGSARLEAGQVFTRSAVGIPDTQLFRAGGENSVRGYGYRTLGPSVGDVTVGGRTLLTASLEAAHTLLARYPEYLGAVFIDAGNAADRWTELHPSIGYGVGVRWRSPVGPLSVDVAYGQATQQFKVHLSVGVQF